MMRRLGRVLVWASLGVLVLTASQCNGERQPPEEHTLSVTLEGEGSGSVVSDPSGIDCPGTCQADFDDGATVTLTASVEVGSSFDGWVGCDSSSGDECSITLDSDASITASFLLDERDTTLEGVIAPRRISVSPGSLEGHSLDSLNSMVRRAGIDTSTLQGVGTELLSVLLDLHETEDSLLAGQQVVAVEDDGNVVASGIIQKDGSFSFNVPMDTTIALILARDDDEMLLCGDVLGYQELDGNRTTAWMEAFLRFESGTTSAQSIIDAGTFNFNELNALPASDMMGAPPALVMDGPAGAFEDCDAELERVTITADFSWETPDGFDEEEIYDFGFVLAFGVDEQDRDSLTLLGAGPIDDQGRAELRFSKRPGEEQRVLLVLSDVGIFDSNKIGYPLTPAAIIEFNGQENVVVDDDFDYGSVGGGMVFVEGVITREDTGQVVPNADVFAFLNDEKEFAFNVATANSRGEYSMLLPTNQREGVGYFLIATDLTDGWTGSACEQACGMPDVGRQERNISVRDPDLVELFVEKSVEGSGSVTSNPPGIDCGDTCQADFAVNSDVVLIATPDEDSVFVGWEGCDSDDGNECTVTMNEDRAVMANFEEESNPEPDEFELSVELSGQGDGTVISDPGGIDCPGVCGADFEEGTQVILTATADEGSVFESWTGCDNLDENQCTVVMNEDRGVTVVFEPAPQPPAEVRRVGFVTMSESSPENSQSPGALSNGEVTVAGVGWFFELEEEAPADFLDNPFGVETAICTVDSVTQMPEFPPPLPEVPSDFSFLDVGEQLDVLVDGNNYTQLSRQEFEVGDELWTLYATDSADENGAAPEPPLAESGLIVNIPGGNDFPAFEGSAFPSAPTFELNVSTDPYSITPETEFGWAPSGSDDAFVEIRAEDNTTSVTCTVPDVGVFVFPEETQEELANEFFSVGYLSYAGRTMFVSYEQGDTVLFLSVVREVTYFVP